MLLARGVTAARDVRDFPALLEEVADDLNGAEGSKVIPCQLKWVQAGKVATVQ